MVESLDQEKIIQTFNRIWKENLEKNVNETEKRLSYIDMKDLFKPFTI